MDEAYFSFGGSKWLPFHILSCEGALPMDRGHYFRPFSWNQDIKKWKFIVWFFFFRELEGGVNQVQGCEEFISIVFTVQNHERVIDIALVVEGSVSLCKEYVFVETKKDVD